MLCAPNSCVPIRKCEPKLKAARTPEDSSYHLINFVEHKYREQVEMFKGLTESIMRENAQPLPTFEMQRFLREMNDGDHGTFFEIGLEEFVVLQLMSKIVTDAGHEVIRLTKQEYLDLVVRTNWTNNMRID